jgi:hypothetical protein
MASTIKLNYNHKAVATVVNYDHKRDTVVANWPNKLEYHITIGCEDFPETNTLAYLAHL